MIVRPVECVDVTGHVDIDALPSVLSEHANNVKNRLDKLKDYYDGKHPILNRRRTDGLPNNQLVHNFPRYITTMASGYLIGNSVSYTYAKEENIQRGQKQGGDVFTQTRYTPMQDETFEDLLDAYKRANIDAVDSELAKHASIFGKAVELTYVSEGETEIRTSTIDPRNAFVVYDDTVENKPLFGIRRYKVVGVDGNNRGYRVHVYTAQRETVYEISDIWTPGQYGSIISDEEHYFGEVPLVEYWNNEEECGDFEAVLSLIDAYNVLQSDRINDKEQFVDAILFMSGVSIIDDEKGQEDSERLFIESVRRNKMIVSRYQEASAEWLSKVLSESDTDVLKDALKVDIHKLSLIPDLTDKQFASNSSGIAMRYKLLGLEQLTKIKERWFREALLTRMRLYVNYKSILGAASFDLSNVQVTFTHSLPNNDLETSQMIGNLQGIVPNAILVKQLPFVDNVEDALEMLRQEKEEAMEMQKRMMDDYPDANAHNANKADDGPKDEDE